MKNSIHVGAAAMAVFCLLAMPVLASDTGSSVSLQPLIDPAIDIIAWLVGLAVSWAATKFSIKLNMDIDARHREALHSAIKSAVSGYIARSKTGDISFDVKSEALAGILRDIRDSVPDAMKRLNPSDAVVSNLAERQAIDLVAGIDKPNA